MKYMLMIYGDEPAMRRARRRPDKMSPPTWPIPRR